MVFKECYVQTIKDQTEKNSRRLTVCYGNGTYIKARQYNILVDGPMLKEEGWMIG